jgi:hypothetical protein
MISDDTQGAKQLYNLDWLVGGGLTLAAFCLYLLTLAPTVLEADSGEFQFVPWLPGITHPTGYPLYTLLGWLWTHLLPLGDVAWRMNLLSAVFAAVTVGLTYAVARQLLDQTLPDTFWPARIIAAAIAAGTFAISHTFWSQAVVAEVYSLHAMFVAVILWLALRLRRTDCGKVNLALHAWPAKLLTFTFGLSFWTHHRTTILLLPALVLFLVWPVNQNVSPALSPGEKSPGENSFDSHRPRVRESTVEMIKLLFTHGILLVAPLLLNLYLPLIAPSTPYTTLILSDAQTLVLYENSLPGFWNHIMATVFTGELQPAAVGFNRIYLTWELLQQQVGWIGVILAIIGLFTLWQRKQVALLLLTGLGSLAFVLFNLIYFIGDVFVLFIPAWLFVCLWIGVGSLGLAHWVADGLVRRKIRFSEGQVFGEMEQRLGLRVYRLLTVGLVVVLFLIYIVFLAMRNYNEVNQQNNTDARERWLEILAEPIPQNAVLLSNDRNEIMPMWYYQYVEARRPDLIGLFPLIVTDPAYANVGRVLDQALASGRPVYLIKPMDGLSLKADLTQVGTLYRAVAKNAPPTYRYDVVLPEITVYADPSQSKTESIKLLGYDLASDSVLPGDEVTIILHWQTTQELSIDYTSYVHLVNSNGQGVSQSDHKPGGDFYPSSYWQIGETLRDHHALSIPIDAPAGLYHLWVGMYYQPEPGSIVSMGNGEEIGQLTVSAEMVQ